MSWGLLPVWRGGRNRCTSLKSEVSAAADACAAKKTQKRTSADEATRQVTADSAAHAAVVHLDDLLLRAQVEESVIDPHLAVGHNSVAARLERQTRSHRSCT